MSRRFQWSRSRKGLMAMALFVLGLLALGANTVACGTEDSPSKGVGVAESKAPLQGGQSKVTGAKSKAPPDKGRPKVSRPVDPDIPLVDVQWVNIGDASSTEQVKTLPIPWGNWSAAHGPGTRAEELEFSDAINFFTDHYHGSGDGRTYFLSARTLGGKGGKKETTEFFLTIDQGKTWYKVANLPPARLVVLPYPGVAGAHLEGDKVALYMYTDYRYTQQNPFLLSYWRGEIPVNRLFGGSSP